MKWRVYLDDCLCIIFAGSYEEVKKLYPEAWSIREYK